MISHRTNDGVHVCMCTGGEHLTIPSTQSGEVKHDRDRDAHDEAQEDEHDEQLEDSDAVHSAILHPAALWPRPFSISLALGRDRPRELLAHQQHRAVREHLMFAIED